LVPVTLLATLPMLLVTHPSVPVSDVRQFVAYAKANPGTLNYASVGAGSSTHIAAELFKDMTGIQMTHVPYKGSSLAYQDLLAGRVQVMFATMITGLPYAREGRLKALAVTTPGRSPAAPDVP